MEQILTTDFLNGLGVSGVCVLVLIGLTTEKGPLRTKRELQVAEQQNQWLRARNEKQAEQITTLTDQLDTVTQFMGSVKQVAEDKP